MKRLTLDRKIQLVKQHRAYVAKCDGGFFFYLPDRYIKITKETYEELSYVEAAQEEHV